MVVSSALQSLYTLPSLSRRDLMAERSSGDGDDSELQYESKHVHEVYDRIATHFSSTRYKVWIPYARADHYCECGQV